MFTVRYPNGQTIQYNTAHFLQYTSNGWELYTKKDGDWVASIQLSAGAILECQSPCRVFDGQQKIENENIEALTKEIRSLKRKINKSK